jgi:hypothetical protein
MPVDNRPVREPDALCEGCGAQGTAGRASRQNGFGAYVEEHRYCADCWPRWSVFHRADWEERGRRGDFAWDDGLPGAPVDPLPPQAWGMVFASATWHEVLDLVNQITEIARCHPDRLDAEELIRLAAQIRDQTSERVGPMPLEVRAFLTEFGGERADAIAS